MKNKYVRNLTLSALFLAIGFLLPFLTGQIQQIGQMLLPMHIPVLLCGLICGWQYGAAVGAILPIMRSLITTMPPLYPGAVAMAFELAAYGLVAGLVYSLFRKKNIGTLYVSLIAAMIAGRAVWGGAMIVLLGIKGGAFTWQAFAAGAFANAFPGIILQLVLIPSLVLVLQAAGLTPYGRDKAKK